MADLRRRAAHLPPPGRAGLTFGLWSRGGGDETLAGHPEVRTFTPADMLAAVRSAGRDAARDGGTAGPGTRRKTGR